MTEFVLTAENNWVIFAFFGFFVLFLLARVLKARRFFSSVAKDATVNPTEVLPEAQFMRYFAAFPFRMLPKATLRDISRGSTHGQPWVAGQYLPNSGPRPLLMVRAGPVLPSLVLTPHHPVLLLADAGGGRYMPTEGTVLDGRFRARADDPRLLDTIPPWLVDALPDVKDGTLSIFFEHGVVGILGDTSARPWVTDPEQRDAMAHRLAWIAQQRVVPPGLVAPSLPVTIDAFFSRDEWPWPQESRK